MKVILKETIDSLGIIGSEVTVADGYARNYLLPQNKAVQATPQNRRVLEQEKGKFDLQIAKDLFKAAAECGVDAVKLQKRDNKSLFTKAAYNRPYDNRNSFGQTYGAHREALEFGKEEYSELKKYAKGLGVAMFATAFDIPSADFLADLDMPVYKSVSRSHCPRIKCL